MISSILKVLTHEIFVFNLTRSVCGKSINETDDKDKDEDNEADNKTDNEADNEANNEITTILSNLTRSENLKTRQTTRMKIKTTSLTPRQRDSKTTRTLLKFTRSVGGESDNETDNEDEDEDNEALGDGPADNEVVPAHVRPRLRLDILLHHFAPSSGGCQLPWCQPGGRLGLQSAGGCHTLAGRRPTNQY